MVTSLFPLEDKRAFRPSQTKTNVTPFDNISGFGTDLLLVQVNFPVGQVTFVLTCPMRKLRAEASRLSTQL